MMPVVRSSNPTAATTPDFDRTAVHITLHAGTSVSGTASTNTAQVVNASFS